VGFLPDIRDVELMYERLKPLLFQFDPEQVHDFAMRTLRFSSQQKFLLDLMAKLCQPQDERLKVKLWNLEFANAVGLAAGFDKNALALPAWSALGFGFVEIGSVTALGQPGNPKPRLFRLPEDRAIINRMGFNNDGSSVIAARLELWRHSHGKLKIPLGINLGKSKITSLEDAPQDYLTSLKKLWEYGDYFVLNVSSPNTPNLRELQDKDKLEVLLETVMDFANTRETQKPILLKVAPDLSFEQLDEILLLLEKHKLSGIIATNTTLARDGLKTQIEQTGGLSGAPLEQKSFEILKHLNAQLNGKLPIISVGGISSGDAVQQRLDAGASLVQVYSGWIFEGPMMLQHIARTLLQNKS
jgi:dihydroorotate dehydrogenase